MILHSFTAQELLCMAVYGGYETICGIPNEFSIFEQNEAVQQFYEILDALVDAGVLIMDFDGEVTLSHEYTSMIASCCECKKCLTISRQKKDENCQTQIFWHTDEGYLMADLNEDKYIFYAVDFPPIAAAFCWQTASRSEPGTVTVPDMLLHKAKRQLQMDSEEACLRTLYQNGVSKEIAAVIVDGFLNHAEFLEIKLITKEKESNAVKEVAFLGSRGLSVEMVSTLMQFRNSTEFRIIDKNVINEHIQMLYAAFLEK